MKDSQISQQRAAGTGEIDFLIGGDGTKRSGVVVVAMMHTDNAPSKEEKYVQLPSEMWRSEYPEYGRLRVSLYGTHDAAAKWEDAYATVLTEHGFARGVASPCSFCCKKRGIRVVVHGDDFLSGGPRSQLGWLENVMDKHFEAKHTVMGESRSLKKSIVMLNRRISWRTWGIMYEPARNTAKELSKH